MGEQILRCYWAGDDPLMQRYHDEEWGQAVHDDTLHFELLILEGAQAGLSWRTVLRKRDGYRRAFADFDLSAVAAFSAADVERLMGDEGVIRNRAKIVATIGNAKAFQQVQDECGTFDSYIWKWTDGKTIHMPAAQTHVPAKTELSDRISKDLLKRGFKFVGSTITYSYLQAAGLVDDHLPGCFRAFKA